MTLPADGTGPDYTVLVLAPTGRDSGLLVELLDHHQIAATTVDAAQSLQCLHRQQGGVFLLAEEALSMDFITKLGQSVQQQPTWADFPFIILTSRVRDTTHAQRLKQERLASLNYTLMERPVQPDTLIAGVRSALRARSRQYAVRSTLEELRQASLSLETSEERNRLILQSTRDCIKLLDLAGNLLTMNAEGRERFAISDFETVRGHSWLDFWSAPYRELATTAIASAVQGEPGRFEGEFKRSDGELSWWDVSVTPVRDNTGLTTHLLAVSREITTRKRTEKALIESEKLAAVGRLAASISHEINNPLEAVTNLLYILTTDPSLSSDARTHLSMAEHELARVSQIAGQTLRFHRQSTRPRSLTARELLEPVLALYQGRLVNSHISIEMEVRDPGELTCYEGEIRQVLNNLVGNAIDAMRSRGGRLRIRAQRSRDWNENRKGARITIADTGHGMPPEVARRVFEAFYTTKGDNGNGLGLWISKGIVQKHHGSLRVRSRSSNMQATGTIRASAELADRTMHSGTVFSLFLPAQLAEAS